MWIISGATLLLIASKETNSLNRLRQQIRTVQRDLDIQFRKNSDLIYQQTTFLKSQFRDTEVISEFENLNKRLATERAFDKKFETNRTLSSRISKITLRLISNPGFAQSQEFNHLTEQFNKNIDVTNKLVSNHNDVVRKYLEKRSNLFTGLLSHILAFPKYKTLN